jgi:hypothetical protein
LKNPCLNKSVRKIFPLQAQKQPRFGEKITKAAFLMGFSPTLAKRFFGTVQSA